MARALALTDQQMKLVQSAARALRVDHRPDFLNHIADELMHKQSKLPAGGHFTDADLSAAVKHYIERFAGAP
jgi:hypothetical protein